MNTLATLAGVEGIYVSPVFDISSTNMLKKSNIQWTFFDNSDCIYTVETNVSEDAGYSWLGWQTTTNNNPISDLSLGQSLINKRLKFRIIFETLDELIVPKIYTVTISVNGYYLVLNNNAILTYTKEIPVGYTQTYYITLYEGFTGIFADFETSTGDKFEIGYNGSKFYYKNGYRITAGLERIMPTEEFLVGVKNNKVIIKTSTFEEILQ